METTIKTCGCADETGTASVCTCANKYAGTEDTCGCNICA
jgi:hypothetical protein